MFDHETAQYMLTLVEGDLEYIRHNSTLDNREVVTHHHGETDHIGYLERPFLEAQGVLHKRMHEHGINF